MSIIVVSFDPEAVTAAAHKSDTARSHSLKWSWLNDILRAKGYSKAKAAAISNSRLKFRKKGRIKVLNAKQADNPAVMARLRKATEAGKYVTGKQLTAGFAATSKKARANRFVWSKDDITEND